MPEVPEEVKKFLQDLEKSIAEAKASLEKARWFIKIGREMGFDVTEQERRQEELERQIERMEETRRKYLKG